MKKFDLSSYLEREVYLGAGGGGTENSGNVIFPQGQTLYF